ADVAKTYHLVATASTSPDAITEANPGLSDTANVDATALTKAPQTITFNPGATGVVGNTPTLSATGGGAGEPVTFTIDATSGAGVCSLSGSTVSFDHVGSCVVEADQAGDASYLAAPTVKRTIVVGGKAAAITGFMLPLTGLVADPDITLSATGGGSSK